VIVQPPPLVARIGDTDSRGGNRLLAKARSSPRSFDDVQELYSDLSRSTGSAAPRPTPSPHQSLELARPRDTTSRRTNHACGEWANDIEAPRQPYIQHGGRTLTIPSENDRQRAATVLPGIALPAIRSGSSDQSAFLKLVHCRPPVLPRDTPHD
jgi:hypothetical protein